MGPVAGRGPGGDRTIWGCRSGGIMGIMAYLW